MCLARWAVAHEALRPEVKPKSRLKLGAPCPPEFFCLVQLGDWCQPALDTSRLCQAPLLACSHQPEVMQAQHRCTCLTSGWCECAGCGAQHNAEVARAGQWQTSSGPGSGLRLANWFRGYPAQEVESKLGKPGLFLSLVISFDSLSQSKYLTWEQKTHLHSYYVRGLSPFPHFRQAENSLWMVSGLAEVWKYTLNSLNMTPWSIYIIGGIFIKRKICFLLYSIVNLGFLQVHYAYRSSCHCGGKSVLGCTT